MKALIKLVSDLKESDIKNIINERINEFIEIGKKDNKILFKELCFCLMTANFNAERAIKIQKEIGDGLINLSEINLAKKLQELGHRFPNKRAEFIVKARQHKNDLREILNSKNERYELRNWIADNIKGLGLKESSHFLRNIGYMDYAIIDFHIIDLLVEYNLIEKPKNISKKIYFEIEKVLEKLGKRLSLNLSELDLYLWYLETGKILK